MHYDPLHMGGGRPTYDGGAAAAAHTAAQLAALEHRVDMLARMQDMQQQTLQALLQLQQLRQQQQQTPTAWGLRGAQVSVPVPQARGQARGQRQAQARGQAQAQAQTQAQADVRAMLDRMLGEEEEEEEAGEEDDDEEGQEEGQAVDGLDGAEGAEDAAAIAHARRGADAVGPARVVSVVHLGADGSAQGAGTASRCRRVAV